MFAEMRYNSMLFCLILNFEGFVENNFVGNWVRRCWCLFGVGVLKVLFNYLQLIVKISEKSFEDIIKRSEIVLQGS